MPICNLQTMSDGDCVFCFMFDEVSIRGNLHFNQKFGCIEGFEDLGNQGKTSNVAIIPWSSCSMVSVKSGSNQYLTTWFTEALRVWGLLISWCRTGSCSHCVCVRHECQKSRRWNCWVFLKRCFYSVLQLYLILPICLKAYAFFSNIT